MANTSRPSHHTERERDIQAGDDGGKTAKQELPSGAYCRVTYPVKH